MALDTCKWIRFNHNNCHSVGGANFAELNGTVPSTVSRAHFERAELSDYFHL